MVQDEIEIAAIGLEDHVEDIAEKGHGADGDIDTDIAEHLGDLGVRHAEAASFVDDPERDDGAARIADAGNEPDDRVGAEADPGAGHADSRVHQAGHAADAAQTPETIGGMVGVGAHAKGLSFRKDGFARHMVTGRELVKMAVPARRPSPPSYRRRYGRPRRCLFLAMFCP